MRTIQWKCTLGADWQWQSGSAGNPGFRTPGDDVRKGVITLPPNADYWYDCVNLALPGGVTGNAYVRYFNEGGVDKVQAITVAQGQWEEAGPIDDDASQTNGRGGINLFAHFA